MALIRLPFSLAAAALVAGCGATPSPEIAEQGGEPIACALGGAERLEADCMLVRASDGGELVIRHPDGGFRRFVGSAGADWRTADGAQAVAASAPQADGTIELAVGEDRYRLPPMQPSENAGE